MFCILLLLIYKQCVYYIIILFIESIFIILLLFSIPLRILKLFLKGQRIKTIEENGIKNNDIISLFCIESSINIIKYYWILKLLLK